MSTSASIAEVGPGDAAGREGARRYRADRGRPGPFAMYAGGSARATGKTLLVVVALASAIACAQEPADADEAPSDTTEQISRRVAADWLTALPDGERKRWFVDQCAGCHVLDERIFRVEGAPRSPESWAAQIRAMMEFAGADTDFPILRPSLDADSLAAWLARHAPETPPSAGAAIAAGSDGPAPAFSDAYEVRFYPMPDSTEIPHDVAVDSTGRVVVTGMGTHAMYVLDPGEEEFREVPIPVEFANPRAVEIDAEGVWWVLLGYPRMLARYRPESEAWETWELGHYPHEIAFDGEGRVWFNGHFSTDPEILGHVDPASGQVRTFEVPYPSMPDGGSTIPYGLREGRDGRIWMTQLFGGRLVAFDPTTGTFEAVEFTPGAGPRRPDVDGDGRIWVPEFGAGRLAVHDPATGRLTRFAFPIADALPYVARIDGDGGVWLGTAAAGVIGHLDPTDGRWELVRLDHEAPLVRHLAVDPRSGDVWAAVSPFPARDPGVFRVSPRGEIER